MSHVGCIGRSGCTVDVCVPPSYRNDDNGNRNHAGVGACPRSRLNLPLMPAFESSPTQQIADIRQGEHFHAEGSIDQYSQELSAIVRRLGGARPVELIR